MGLAIVRRVRNVPAKRGMRVQVDGKEGRITSAYGHNLMVRFPGQTGSRNCHPTWRVTYFDSAGNVLMKTKD